MLLHWAATTESAGYPPATTESSEAAAAAEAEGEDNQRPAFVETAVGGLVSQLAQLTSEAAGRDHPAVGLAAAVGLGQLLQRLQGRKALQDAVAGAMLCVVTATARRAALDQVRDRGRVRLGFGLGLG